VVVFFSVYLEGAGRIECQSGFQSRQLISRLEAAPTKSLSNLTWVFQISRLFFIKVKANRLGRVQI
jgi:hypothetical protein